MVYIHQYIRKVSIILEDNRKNFRSRGRYRSGRFGLDGTRIQVTLTGSGGSGVRQFALALSLFDKRR